MDASSSTQRGGLLCGHMPSRVSYQGLIQALMQPTCLSAVYCVQAHIVSLPEEVMNTPFGRSMLPMLQPHLQDTLGNATATGFGSAPAASGSAAPSHAREDPAEAIANAVDEATHTHIAHDLQVCSSTADRYKLCCTSFASI